MPAPRSSRGRRGPLAGSRGGPGVTVNEALGSGSGGEGEGAVSSVLVHLPPQPTHGDDGRRPWNAGPPPPPAKTAAPGDARGGGGVETMRDVEETMQDGMGSAQLWMSSSSWSS
jgi:hypothetical protein